MTKLLCVGDKCFIPGEVYEVEEDGVLRVRFESLGSKNYNFVFKPDQVIGDTAELAGFMSGLHEVENFISFMERAGTGEDFTRGYNQALTDLNSFVQKQKTYEGKELLKYETRSADGERVRKDRWETAIRNIAHLFFGPRGEWEIDDVIERVKGVKASADALAEAVARPSVEDETPQEEARYGRGAGMNRAPDDLPTNNRAAWLRHEASSLGQTKIYQPQYEELRVHAADLWKKLKTIKEALKS